MTGGTVKGGIFGGYGGTTAANYNTVNLGGGTVLGQNISAEESLLGVAMPGGVYGGYSDAGATQNNTVSIYGAADLSAVNVYGGNREATGNTLNIGKVLENGTYSAWTGGNQSVKNIANFENINFAVVPWSSSTAALTITDGTSSDLSTAKVSADGVYFTNTYALSPNKHMTLLNAAAITDTDKKLVAANITSDSTFTVGTSAQGRGTVSLDESGNVIYTVTQGANGNPLTVQEQTHNTVMGMAASLATLNTSNDFVGKTIDGLQDAHNIGKDGIATFAALGGSESRYDTGSHIKTNNWNAIAGVGKTEGKFTYGAFAEYGKGNYRTYNGDNYGSGAAKFAGGGVLGKWQNERGVYVEGSLRMGEVHDTASNILCDAIGNAYGYKERTPYYGAHIGLGRVYALGGSHELDVSGKFYLTHRRGMSFDAGGAYDLDGVSSKILSLGAMYRQTGKLWNRYGGAAFEYEFDGEAKGTADGIAIRAADISGGSVRLTFGTKLKPSETSPWSADVNLTGYMGKHRGFGGAVSLAYAF